MNEIKVYKPQWITFQENHFQNTDTVDLNKLDINIFITDTWRKYVGDKWRLELRF